jgi:cell division protein ZapA
MTEARAPQSVTLDVTILGREFKVACREDERDELLEAVALLDRRMREIRDKGKVSGTDRIAVMAALNIAHELLRERRSPSPAVPVEPASGGESFDAEAARRRIQAMQATIDETLAGQENLF